MDTRISSAGGDWIGNGIIKEETTDFMSVGNQFQPNLAGLIYSSVSIVRRAALELEVFQSSWMAARLTIETEESGRVVLG